MVVLGESGAGHVAVLPSPGMGHIIPLLELAKRLTGDHGCHVSFLNITAIASTAQNELLRSSDLPSNLHVIDLPPADVTDIVADVPDSLIVTRLSMIVEENLKCLKSVLQGLGDVRAVVIDIFSSKAIEVCEELHIPVYSFFTASTALFTFSLYLPILEREVVERGFVELPEPVRVPGCSPVRTENLLEYIKGRKLPEYDWYLCHVSRLPKAAGIFLNTWQDFERVPIRAIREDRFYTEVLKIPPVYPIGPLVKMGEPVSESGRECLTWLDKQPERSVMFIALGSGGTLTAEQVTEMAWGLEMSRQRFLWVVRPPSDVASGLFFDAGREAVAAAYLPEGFAERTKEVGLVVQSWAPQAAVLGHVATAAFWSHCGWNSTMETLSHGVPMIAWPLYAEQRMNAAVLSEEAHVAMWPWPWEGLKTGRVVRRGEIERVVRMAIDGQEGKALRRRAKELKESAARALLSGGGSSYESLARVAKEWTKA